MKKVTVDFPVVGWASVTIEVEDHLTEDDIRDMIADDDIQVPWSPADNQNLFPVLSLREFIREGGDGEVPFELEVGE